MEQQEVPNQKYLSRRKNAAVLIIIDNMRIAVQYRDGIRKKRKRHYRIWHILNKIKAKAPGFINSHEYKQLPKHLHLLHDKLCNKHTLAREICKRFPTERSCSF